MQEVWRPVVGYEGLYEVSSLGAVRAPAKWTRTKGDSFYLREPRPIKAIKSRYWTVCLYKGGIKRTWLVHQLVAESFIGPRPFPHYVICHGKGGIDDNSVTNLRYDTQSGNLSDREAAGTLRIGSNHGMAVLNEDDVHYIRRQMAAGVSSATLARQFNVSRELPWKIYKRLLWRHI